VGRFWDGSFTDYGTAVGTVGLAALAAWTAVREGKERKQLRKERDEARAETARLKGAEEEREALTNKRLYASSVSCYIDRVAYDPDIVTMPPGEGGVPMAGASMECGVVRNMSDKPIRNVEVIWQRTDGSGPVHDVAIAGPVLVPLVPLGFRAVRRPSELDPSWNRTNLTLLIKFDDFNGCRWARREDGRLYEVDATGALGPEVGP
jgi:hypothetical protein